VGEFGFKGQKMISEFHDYLKDKNVIIVGPAAYLLGKNKGEFIDNFDVVVRISEPMHKIVYPEDYGTKMNILYLPPSLSRIFVVGDRATVNSWSKPKTFSKTEKGQIYKRWAEMNLEWVVARINFKSVDKEDNFPIPFKWVEMEKEFINNLNEQAKDRIKATGTLAIIHLLESDLKTLSAIGFDFYQTGYFHARNDWKIGRPKMNKKHLKFLKSIVEQDKRLVIDETLRGILYEN